MDYEELLEEVDIYDYVSQYVELEERGGEYWGLSPFKEEKTPSFSVDTEKQRFCDFSSGYSGDLLTFIKEYHHVDFLNAMQMLMKFAGIEDTGEYISRPSILKEMRKYISKKKKEKEYVYRKILDSSCMDKYWDGEEKLMSCIREGIDRQTLKNHQVKYNPQDDSLVFPLFDSNGNIISICSRTLCGRIPKYISYNKYDGVDFFYWEYQNRKNIIDKNEIIIFEGAKSVMVAESMGYNNCVSSQTNHLNDDQLKILIRLGVPVVFAYDKGVDIKQDKNIMRLAHYTKIEYVQDDWFLLKNKDAPIDYGLDIWKYLYERRKVL